MIYRNLELHNVEEVQESRIGAVLQRFPARVRQQLEKRRNFRAEDCPGVEIRFASDAFCTELVLRCLYGGGLITVFRGDHVFAVYPVSGGQSVTLHLEPNEEWDRMEFGGSPVWSRNIWRIQLPPAQFAFCHLEDYGCPVRPPREGERPEHTLLAYGSSITQGCFAQNNTLSYVQHAAARMGWDVRNCGLSGACFCEPAMAEFLAGLEGWDAAFLELGVNMRPFFTEEEFRERAENLIGRVCGSHPGNPVLLTTIYPNAETFRREKTLLYRREEGYNRVLREIAGRGERPNLSLTEGRELLRDPGYLGADLIHPTDFGHICMGEALAGLLRQKVHLAGKGHI